MTESWRLDRTVNAADPGEKPRMELRYQGSHAFGYETVGISRYYTALQAKEKIEEVVHIWRDRTIQYGRCLPDRGRILPVRHGPACPG